MDDLKDRLKFLYKSQNLNQKQFAELIGIGQSTFNNYLTGIAEPNFKQLSILLRSLPDLNAEWLMIGVGEPYKNNSIQNNELYDKMNQNIEKMNEDKTHYNPPSVSKEQLQETKETKPTELELVLKKLEMIQIEMWRLNERVEKLEKK